MLRSGIKSAIQRTVRRAGYTINRINKLPTMDAALRRHSQHHAVHTIVDIGASDGRWSELARQYYPDSSFLLIEALADPHGAALERLRQRRSNLHYVLAAAGGHTGTIHFDASDPFGGAASENPFTRGDLIVPMTTVDAEVARLSLAGPFLLKLDTHGFEIPIFEGAASTLDQTSLLIVEAYNFELRPGALRFHELCTYLGGRGFRPLDVVDVMRRPGDDVLWQFDLFFARNDSREFASSAFS